MESHTEISPSEPGHGRKRIRDVKNKTFQCSLLTQRDINHFHKVFYNISKKLVQDAFILKYTAADFPRTQKKHTAANKKQKSVH